MIGFLHTATVHIDRFDRLLAEFAPTVAARHLVDETLLSQAQTTGITPPLRQRLARAAQTLIQQRVQLIICTCSTLGAVAESLPTAVPLMRIDRPMAEQAVTWGGRILVAATVASTIAPTGQLLEAIAAERGQPCTWQPWLCHEAWPYFEAGNLTGYYEAINRCLAQAPACEVIVLAQASMAPVTAQFSSQAVPILSSPRAAVQHALKQLEHL